ncbi:hypothetical protein [Ruminococcus sp.]|uniref:hypothetical protein n=1 Tax=Ruminococcus sp. TaxID=41978 RepID=UPI001B3CAA5C|nr:hypothetical protein [Ruminococcus sp.]MBP5432736.1 hypothetical protein [Ruminococcus sp.]
MTYRRAKRIYFTLVTAAVIAVFIVVCTLGQEVHRKRVEARLAAAAVHEGRQGFIVRESGGRAAVFRNGEEKPYLLIDVELPLLSDFDREALYEGIYISSEKELRQFIEDISS